MNLNDLELSHGGGGQVWLKRQQNGAYDLSKIEEDKEPKRPTEMQLELRERLSIAGYRSSWWCPRSESMKWYGRLYFKSTHPTAKIWLKFDPAGLCCNPILEIKIPNLDWGDPEHEDVWHLFTRAERIALEYEKELWL